MPHMVKINTQYQEWAYSSNIYPKKNYKLTLIQGTKKKIRRKFLQRKEPYVKKAWLKLEEAHATDNIMG